MGNGEDPKIVEYLGAAEAVNCEASTTVPSSLRAPWMRNKGREDVKFFLFKVFQVGFKLIPHSFAATKLQAPRAAQAQNAPGP